MTYNLLWKNADGTLIVTALSKNATMEEALAHKDVLAPRMNGATFSGVVDSAALPQDRYFRPAWRFDGANVTLDTQACQDRHLEKLRRVRNTQLAASDADYIKALEQNNTATLAALKTYRQDLRDMPQKIDFSAAKTPADIRNVQPAALVAANPAQAVDVVAQPALKAQGKQG